jgi:hypothetical protein
MNDLAEIINQAEADIHEYEALVVSADARVAAAQADAVAAREKLSEARIVLDWLHRRSQSQPVTAPPASQNGHSQQPVMRFGRPVPEVAKLDKCLEALEGLGGTATNKQISSRLLRDGFDLDPDHVRGLLKYASKKNPSPVTTETGSGLWRLVRAANGTAGGEG